MNALAQFVLIVSLLSTPAIAAEPEVSGDQPVYVWQRGKDGDNPLDALTATANLPRGVPGQSREELRDLLVAAGARIVSEDARRIVARGKMANGAELKVDFIYNFENELFVSGPETISGTRIEKPRTAGRPGSAEQAASAQLEALRTRGMGAIVDFMHPEDIERFRAMMQPALEVSENSPDRDEVLGVLGVASLDEARALSAPDLMRAMFTVLDSRMRGVIQFDRFEIIGSVSEDDLVHVLVRIHMGSSGITMHNLEVVSLKPYDGGWRAALSGDIEGMGQAIAKKFSSTEGVD